MSQISILEPHPPSLPDWTQAGLQVLLRNQEAPIDPFAPTDADPPTRPGDLDPGRAVSEGLTAIARNLGPMLAAAAVGLAGYFLSFCTCVGWIVILPVLMWGMYRFLLDAVDGGAKVSTLWAGFSDLGRVFARMWGVLLIYGVISLPILGAVLLSSLVTGGGEALGLPQMEVDPIVLSAASFVPTTLWGLFLVRFVFAPFLVVDRAMGPIEAFGEAWRSSSKIWPRLILLQLLFVLLNLPAQVLSLGAQMIGQKIQEDPSLALDNIGTMMAMTGGVYLLLGIGGAIGFAVFAAAYRQVMGKRD